MECNVLGMEREARMWERREELADTTAQKAYASKQRSLWLKRACASEQEFKLTAGVVVHHDP